MYLKNLFDAFSSFVKQCLNTCISLIKVLMHLKHSAPLPKTSKKSCIIMGNGPSLSQSFIDHPDFFKKHELVCVNNFAASEKFAELKPSYYVMLDPGFWLSDTDMVVTTIKNIQNKTTWPLTILLPPAARKSLRIRELEKHNTFIKISYFNYTVFRGFKGIAHFFYKRNMAMPQSQNVVAASLFLAANIGFKEIYLFGADHTWHENLYVDQNNTVCVKHFHFYENEQKITYTPFYKGTHLKEVFRMDEIFMIFGKTFYSYVAINEYAESINCMIYNASSISYIDAFKRIKI